MARFALNAPATHCDRCLLPLDLEQDPPGRPVRTTLGLWCRTCEETDGSLRPGLHDLRFELAPQGLVACLRCRRLLTGAQVFVRCQG